MNPPYPPRGGNCCARDNGPRRNELQYNRRRNWRGRRPHFSYNQRFRGRYRRNYHNQEHDHQHHCHPPQFNYVTPECQPPPVNHRPQPLTGHDMPERQLTQYLYRPPNVRRSDPVDETALQERQLQPNSDAMVTPNVHPCLLWPNVRDDHSKNCLKGDERSGEENSLGIHAECFATANGETDLEDVYTNNSGAAIDVPTLDIKRELKEIKLEVGTSSTSFMNKTHVPLHVRFSWTSW